MTTYVGSTAAHPKLVDRRSAVSKISLRASPPIVSPCFYGIDMPTRKELIAARYNVAKIKQFLGVDTLAYLSLDGMLKAAKARLTTKTQPIAKPSRPSVRFTAFEAPMTTMAANGI